MLRLPPFELRRPDSVEEAARILASEGPRARVVAGGTDLYPNMKRRHQTAEVVVSLAGIAGLNGISNGDGLTLGAMASLRAVERDPRVIESYPGLATAVRSISSPPLRNMGTIGGNVLVDTRCTYYNQTEDWRRSIDFCMKAEGTVCWVAPSSPRCWAHSASDSAPMLAALGATLRLQGPEGERELPIRELYREDGIEYHGKAPDEILTTIHLPAEADASVVRSAFWKLRRRGSIDFAVLSAAAALRLDPEGRVEEAQVWLGAVGSSPRFAAKTCAALEGELATAETIATAAALAPRSSTPMDNTDFKAQWRRVMVQRYAEAALLEAAGLAFERLPPRHV